MVEAMTPRPDDLPTEDDNEEWRVFDEENLDWYHE